MTTNVDKALLLAEWVWVRTGDDYHHCPACLNYQPDGKHEPDCVLDLALAERGYATQEDRNRARGFIERDDGAARATMAPPTPR